MSKTIKGNLSIMEYFVRHKYKTHPLKRKILKSQGFDLKEINKLDKPNYYGRFFLSCSVDYFCVNDMILQVGTGIDFIVTHKKCSLDEKVFNFELRNVNFLDAEDIDIIEDYDEFVLKYSTLEDVLRKGHPRLPSECFKKENNE